MCVTLDIPLPKPIDDVAAVRVVPGAGISLQGRFVANRAELQSHPMLSTDIATVTKGRSVVGVRQVCALPLLPRHPICTVHCA
jgi:hypothetical protein